MRVKHAILLVYGKRNAACNGIKACLDIYGSTTRYAVIGFPYIQRDRVFGVLCFGLVCGKGNAVLKVREIALFPIKLMFRQVDAQVG